MTVQDLHFFFKISSICLPIQIFQSGSIPSKLMPPDCVPAVAPTVKYMSAANPDSAGFLIAATDVDDVHTEVCSTAVATMPVTVVSVDLQANGICCEHDTESELFKNRDCSDKRGAPKIEACDCD